VSWEGNSTHNGFINTSLINVTPLHITINGPDVVKVGDTAIIEGMVLDDDGNPVANQIIDFFVDGVYIGSGITDENGSARINHTFNKAGNPKLTVTHILPSTYGLNDPISASKNTKVNKIPSKITISVPEEIKVGETVTLESKLTDENGNPIANATVDFYVDGKKVGSAKTDKNGIAKLQYKFTKSGNPTITAKFPGNDKYLTSNETTKQ